ncbi:MAG: hydrogenase formation protein HypD, partial [Mailhella sp.]|nr:hydrogenase formation protein HypD [Mailhella sp.]
MAGAIERAQEIIASYQGPPLRIMEVCGTHTHEIFRLGIRGMLPAGVSLISGPGCPVCVTPVGFIDDAVRLSLEKRAAVCSFGDLLRVPGTRQSLSQARAEGADVRVVYSPLDCLRLAAQEPA